jgi:antirestriction protein ArdC
LALAQFRLHAQPAIQEQGMKADIYQKITDQIVSELEKGVRPWFKPWNIAVLR